LLDAEIPVVAAAKSMTIPSAHLPRLREKIADQATTRPRLDAARQPSSKS